MLPLNIIKYVSIYIRIRVHFWVFDKYFHNQSPLNPMNVYGSPLHPCGEILNVNCSGIESGRHTVHSCVLAAMFGYLVLDDSHIGTKWKELIACSNQVV